jgi:hypothetical protein
MKHGLRVLAGLAFAAAATAVSLPANAADYNVFVGYSDGLRGPGFFPNPWNGDPGITFLGSAAPYDAGAIMIQNISGGSLTINSVGVTINGSGNVAPPWTLPVTLGAGDSLILTQTTQYNFDTSDINPISPNGVPVTTCTVTCPAVTIDASLGGTQTFLDSTHTLDTEGFDYAANGSNESFNWRLIGSCSGPGCGGVVGSPGPVPGAGFAGLAALALAGLYARMRRA